MICLEDFNQPSVKIISQKSKNSKSDMDESNEVPNQFDNLQTQQDEQVEDAIPTEMRLNNQEE